jgi:hypothetical protein
MSRFRVSVSNMLANTEGMCIMYPGGGEESPRHTLHSFRDDGKLFSFENDSNYS